MKSLNNLFRSLIVAFAIIAALAVKSCSDNEIEINTARVQFKLVDAPGDYLEVNVEIIDIQYNNSEDENGWESFELQDTIRVDLTELIAGNSLLLADQIMPAGMLNQVRLVLGTENTLKIEGYDEGEGEIFMLDTPSAQQSGLKLKLDTELEAGFSYSFILDWDVQKSIVSAGSSGKYNLKPVIKVISEVNSGSLIGKVIQIVDEVEVVIGGVVVMLSNDLEEWNTETDSEGNFMFQGLPGGEAVSYLLKIEKEGYQPFELAEIDVLAGAITDVGTLELLLTEE